MTPNDFLKNLLTDIKVKVSEEFDRNFERKAFFDKKWPQTSINNRRGTLMMRTGALRRSIQARVQGNGVQFSSSLPYASIHNEGGQITVTPKMKRYFWAMYLQTKNEQYKGLALKKVGEAINIPQRQFMSSSVFISAMSAFIEKTQKSSFWVIKTKTNPYLQWLLPKPLCRYIAFQIRKPAG